MFTDIKIINKVLRHFLKPGVGAGDDEGHRHCGHADKIKCPGNDANPAEKRVMQDRVRAHHKTLMGVSRTGASSSRSFVATACYMAICFGCARC